MRRAAPRWWATAPLRTRLTVLSTALLVLGVALAGVTAASLVQRSLVDGLDAQLEEWTPRLVRQATEGIPRDRRLDLPTDYQVVFVAPDGRSSRWTSGPAQTGPELPTMTVDAVTAREGRPFTVPDTSGTGRWRVQARVLVDDAGPVASVAVALPLDGVDSTLERLRVAVLLITLVVGALGGVGAWWGVRQSLRPLREIEDTAAAIAAGDLTRRVPAAPASTEVGAVAAALNSMLAQVEQAFAARTASEARMRRFVADASHELRTPLATIRGYGELYRMGALRDPEEVGTTLGRIEDSAVRMGSLVEDLLHLARLDENRPLRAEPVDLAVLAGDAAADLHALDPDRPVRVVPLRDADGVGGATAVGDEDRLRQVLANLVGNVVRHTPPGSPVELAVGRLGDDAVALEVRDHGPGIDPEHAARVFERFYRVDAGRGRETGGAGLGLAIVAAIVQAHRGRVGVEPTPGGGTTVRVTLPAAR
ncbi:ATP-binding protein [Actinotalea sp. AC32]|nr:ATP-binding protein [Actinotalea sp. AC32]